MKKPACPPLSSPSSKPPLAVLIDESVGPEDPLWLAYVQWAKARPIDAQWVAQTHPGMPDTEIVHKLLRPGLALITKDRILHNQVIQRGLRSWTLNEKGDLTSKPLSGVPTPALPSSVIKGVKEAYMTVPEDPVTSALKSGLSERHAKGYRTARRRIRGHFGSAEAIDQASLTIGARLHGRQCVVGYALRLSGTSGVPGLRASEGYCSAPLEPHGQPHPAAAVIFALRDLYLLHLTQARTELYFLSPESLALCQSLLPHAGPMADDPMAEALRQMLLGLRRVTFSPCVKGRFFDEMSQKLTALTRTKSNEVVSLDLARVAQQIVIPSEWC
jgi:hypothetical protein